VVNKMTTKY